MDPGLRWSGPTQEMVAETWSDTAEEVAFSSVKVFDFHRDAESNCVSGPRYGFGPTGWGGAGRSDGAAYSPTASCGSSGSSC